MRVAAYQSPLPCPCSQTMAAKGAAALFIPTNNGLPPAKTGPEVWTIPGNADITLAKERRFDCQG